MSDWPNGGTALSLDQVRRLCEPIQGPTGDFPQRTQVLIVGAGPCGLTAANLLGRRGVTVLVVEKALVTSAHPKALALDDEYMRVLVNVGLEPALREHHSAPFGIHFISSRGRPLVKVPGFITANGFGNRSAVMQPVFEKILLAGAQRFDTVTIRYGCGVEAVEQDATGARALVAGKWVEADYLLGCDGASSVVRNALGVSFHGQRIDEPHMVVDLADFPDQSPYSRFFCNPSLPINSIPAPYGGRRLEILLDKAIDRDWARSEEGIRHLVDQHSPYTGFPLHIIRRAPYGFSARIADQFQVKRVFLLGDAAHIMPPFGGQGLNTGARDAANLSWKLARVLSGRAPPGLLNDYDVERRRQVSDIVAYSVWVGRLATIRSPILATLRDAFFGLIDLVPSIRRYLSQMRYMPRPRIHHGLIAGRLDKAGLVGRIFPRLALQRAELCQTIDDLAGEDFCLVGIDLAADELQRAAAHSFWSGQQPSLVSIWIQLNGPADPGGWLVSGPLPAPLRLHRGEIMIIRPDRYVAGSASPAQFAALSDALARQLSPSPARQTFNTQD